MCGHKPIFFRVICLTFSPPTLSPFSKTGRFYCPPPPIIYAKMSASVIISCFCWGGISLLSSSWEITGSSLLEDGDWPLRLLLLFLPLLAGCSTIRSGTELDFWICTDFCIELCFWQIISLSADAWFLGPWLPPDPKSSKLLNPLPLLPLLPLLPREPLPPPRPFPSELVASFVLAPPELFFSWLPFWLFLCSKSWVYFL